jgi:DNA helicase II / ATP-dependent DNA helicase PcrA
LPYRLIGSVKFYERKEIKDIICYMRLILNTNDDVAFYRVVNNPTRGIGGTTLEKVVAMAAEHKISAFEAAGQVAMQRLVHSGACNKLQNFRHLIDTMKNDLVGALPSEVYLRILDSTKYTQKLIEEKTPESQTRIENLEEFHNAIIQFEAERQDEATIQSFLEEMALVSDADSIDEKADAVTLMTLHLSKGLEYKNVFMVGLEEGLFPSGRALDENNGDQLEEERRICYVGMTRARDNLFMSFAKSRRVWGQEEHRPVSRFIGEIPPQYVTANMPLSRPAFLDKYVEKYGSQQSPSQYQPKSFSAKTKVTNPFPDYEGESFSESSFDMDTAPRGADFERGQRVRHPIFGVGSIFQIEGSGELQKVSVLFNDKSLKKFMVKHARLEKI